MTFSAWRKQKGLSLEAVAVLLDKSKGHIHAIEQSNSATARLALDIEKLTDGLVDAADLNTEVREARRQAA